MARTDATQISWIAVDWGTTHCRAWAMSVQNAPLDSASSSDGMSAVRAGQFEATLLSLIAHWLIDDRTTDVLACGMVGARQGWMEVPYATVPCSPVQFDKAVTVPATDSRIRVQLLPGLSQPSPADVMRGEETQIAGLLSEQPEFSGTICMPGTHTKWVRIANGSVSQFKSCMTGELFALLEQQSVLKHSLNSEGFDQNAFDQTIAAIGASTERAGLSDLFSIRASSLLHGVDSGLFSARSHCRRIISEHCRWQVRRSVVLMVMD